MNPCHSPWRARILAALSIGAALAAPAVWAQTAAGSLAEAQARYDRQIAVCNSGNLPAPQRNACVRDAGIALDQVRGPHNDDAPVPSPTEGPASTQITTPDGRATVIVPAPAATIQ